MSENQTTNVDANSGEFRRGVEAGINSEGTKYWQAGYELGQALSDKETKEPVEEVIQVESDSPIFLNDTLDGHRVNLQGDTLEGHKVNLQDEKDATAE